MTVSYKAVSNSSEMVQLPEVKGDLDKEENVSPDLEEKEELVCSLKNVILLLLTDSLCVRHPPPRTRSLLMRTLLVSHLLSPVNQQTLGSSHQ